jgi:hypothetical protein
MEVSADNLLHMLRQLYRLGEEVKRSIEWLIKRLIKVGAKVAYHGQLGRGVLPRPNCLETYLGPFILGTLLRASLARGRFR